jgi:hypothetical protein
MPLIYGAAIGRQARKKLAAGATAVSAVGTFRKLPLVRHGWHSRGTPKRDIPFLSANKLTFSPVESESYNAARAGPAAG